MSSQTRTKSTCQGCGVRPPTVTETGELEAWGVGPVWSGPRLQQRWSVALLMSVWLGLAGGPGAEGVARAGEGLKTRNVLWVTLDGLRWQELLGGADEGLLNKESGGVKDIPALRREFWRETAEARRAVLLPFVWNELIPRGQLFGDASRNSVSRVTNGLNFSYPGYSELLCGFADSRIDSNDKRNNPNVTVLEWLHSKPAFAQRVVAFTSWDVFPYIINSERSGIPVNAGWQPRPAEGADEGDRRRWELGEDLPRHWDGVRYDALTVAELHRHLDSHRPRVIYLSLGETDDFAHEGRYDLYLHSARKNDRLIARLWARLQALPEYAGTTTLIVTTDHGRGDDRVSWKSHGKDLPLSQFHFIAVLGPDTPATGIREGVDVTQSQVAATVARLLGEDYRAAQSRAGEPLPGVIQP